MGSDSFPTACCGFFRFFLMPKVTGYMSCGPGVCVRKVQRVDNELHGRRNCNFPLLISSPQEAGFLNPKPAAFSGRSLQAKPLGTSVSVSPEGCEVEEEARCYLHIILGNVCCTVIVVYVFIK